MSTPGTQDIVAFLAARFDELEAAARAAEKGFRRDLWTLGDDFQLTDPLHGVRGHVSMNSPAYVLADIAAKRRILALHSPGYDKCYESAEYGDPATMRDRPPALCALRVSRRLRPELEPAMTVIDFLLARIAETQALAEAAEENDPSPWMNEDGHVLHRHERGPDYDWDYARDGLWNNEGSGTLSMEPATGQHVAFQDPARVLADCQAKRRIVAMYLAEADQTGPAVGNQETHTARLGVLADVIQTLAAAHDGHEDWNPDWAVDGPGSKP